MDKADQLRIKELVYWFRSILRDIMFNNLVAHIIAKPSVCTKITFFMTHAGEAVYGQTYAKIKELKMVCVRSNPPLKDAASIMVKIKETMDHNMIRKAQLYQHVLKSMERISNGTSLTDIPDGGYTNKNEFIQFLGHQAIMAAAEEVVYDAVYDVKVS